MNYATGAAFNLREMFMNFNTKKMKMSCEECKQLTGDAHRDKLAQKIFKECYKLVLNDIIDNNITFHLPTGSHKSYIHMKRTQGEDFKKARRNGKWGDVDFIASFFSGYQLALTMGGRRTPRTKLIYVDKNLKNKITQNTNAGKSYC